MKLKQNSTDGRYANSYHEYLSIFFPLWNLIKTFNIPFRLTVHSVHFEYGVTAALCSPELHVLSLQEPRHEKICLRCSDSV